VLTAKAVEGFVTTYLLAHYDRASPIKWFHRDWWTMACLPDPNVALGAPRGHSKSTSFNIGYSLAAAMLRTDPFQFKISRTRQISTEFLRAVKIELADNKLLRDDFGILPIKEWPRDTEDDFIAQCEDGYQFRMVALGAEQPMRGWTWGTRRPTLVICDDLEDDEQVLSPDRREKMAKWFMNTLLPIGTVDTKFRVVGTILHAESLLKGLLESKTWTSKVYEACDAELSEASILWPELFPVKRLQNIRANYVEHGNLVGFNMEYRNIAIDTSSGFFQPTDFVETEWPDPYPRKTYYVGVDYAISTAERRDFTVMVVGGLDEEGFLTIADVRKGRWDGKQILDEMFAIQDTFQPEQWFVESGSIQKALGAALEMEQRKRNVYLPLNLMVPTKDKMSRARSIQTRMRSKAVKFDHRATWFPDLESEMTQFPRGRHDDQVDAMAWLGLGLADMVTPLTDREFEFEQMRAQKQARTQATMMFSGRSQITGY
jgi:predicted phage terminase large subunit-like protein